MSIKLKKWHIWAIVIAIIILIYIISTRWLLYCNDAYVEADLIPITPRVDGYLTEVNVHDNQYVHKGDILVQIDPTPYRLQADEAQAALTQAQSQIEVLTAKIKTDLIATQVTQDQLTISETVLKRYQTLYSQGAVDQQSLNNQQTAQSQALGNYTNAAGMLAQDQQQLSVLKATVANESSALGYALYELSLTTLYAPKDGYINHLRVYVGTHAVANSPLFGLVADHSWRVIADYKEEALSRLKPGQTVWVMLYSNPWHLYKGQVQSFGRAVARNPTPGGAALPFIEPTTDWIRYPYRFPVTISLPDLPRDAPIGMGADVRTLAIVP